MADYRAPVNGAAFITYIGLVDQSNTKLLKASPTLTAGDFVSNQDGVSGGNLATLPTVTPAAGKAVKVSLSAGEMTADNVTVIASDADNEWCDQLLNIATGARSIDNLAFPATSGRSMVVDASGLVDANMVKAGPTGAGTAQTARDLGNALPAAAPAASNGLLTVGTSSGQLSPAGGKVTTTYTIVKNTAFNNFMFKMVLSSDHVSPATGKTVTAQRSLDGAAYGACANSVTELSNGTYILNLAAADLNANCVALRFTASGCDATDVIIITQT